MRLAVKLVVILAVLLFMLMMGMSNGRDSVRLKLDMLNYESGPVKVAVMCFIFFGVGVFTGAVLAVGGGGQGGGKGGGGRGKKG